MSKQKTNVITINADKLLNKISEDLDIEITAASIKDDLCNYTYDILSGIGAGDTHQVKGKGLVDDDMLNSFSKLNVHLAVIDDVFKHSRKKIESINKMHGDDLALLYTVTGFKMKGNTEDRSVILVGMKSVSTASDRIQLESPRILLGKFSSYEYHKELKIALDKAITEVELYRNGKYTAIEEPAPVDDKNQGKLELKEAGDDSEFQKGKV